MDAQSEAQVPAISAATVLMIMTGIISAILLGYILRQRHQTGDSSRQTGTIGSISTISGRNNPMIVGPGTVNFTQYSSPPEREEAPAPRTRHSQRPDQKPRQRAHRNQEAELCLDHKTLYEVAERLAATWPTLALKLGFTMAQVKTIETNHQNDITRQGLEMLVTWQQAQSTSDEQQRTTLCTALEKIRRADIARFLQGYSNRD